jgi:putative ABC transport system permease protein
MLNRLPLDQTQGLLFILAATTLLIGGIGVLNMMLDSVHERRSEIGVRLAIGATRRDIIAQFFVETFAITSVGGLTGTALGIGGCLLMGSLDVPDLIPVPVLSWEIVLLALGILTAVGISAGVIPAWRAARVDPASTLRME